MLKKVVSLLTALLLIISTVPLSKTFAAADVTKPVFESISVDKTQDTVGDSVKISVHATDDVGIQIVRVFYKSPITKKSFYVPMNFNAQTNSYEGILSIPSNFEAGDYKVYFVSIDDTSGNNTTVADYSDSLNQLASGQFTVSGTSGADVTKPVFQNISVDKTIATTGDTVKVSVKATDDVGIQIVRVFYKSPITKKSFYVPMNFNAQTNSYEGILSIPSNFETGDYKVYFVSIDDTSGNNTTVADYSDSLNQLASGQFTVSGTSGADVTKPVFQNISVDKTNATTGDTVKVSVKATDDVGIQIVRVFYKSPITKKSFYVPMNFNAQTNSYEGIISIPSTFEAGDYKVYFVSIDDTSSNNTTVADYSDSLNQLASGQFSVFTESNPPSFTKLSIDKKVVESGDQVNFTVDATDDTNLQSATIYYLSPVSKVKIAVPLIYNGSKFVGKLPIEKNTEVGSWKVDSVEVNDTNGNSSFVKAIDTDLSVGDFSVIKSIDPLDNYIVTSSESWSNRTINSDVYIAPGAILTVSNNVTINGNVYVLGGFRSYGGFRLSGSLISNSVYFGYYTPGNGQAVISGSNSISSLIATNRILSDVPFKLYDTPLVSKEGKVNLSGATLPFVSIELNGQSVPLKSNGTFRVTGFNVGTSNSLQVKVTDLYGFTHYYTYTVSEIYIDDFTKDSTSISGKTQPNMSVRIFENDRNIGNGTTDENGHFNIPVTNLKENDSLKFEVSNTENELVTSKEMIVKDITAPDKPVVNDVTDKDTILSGQAESGASVQVKAADGTVIGTGTDGTDSTFTVAIPLQKAGAALKVTATDKAGNVSEASTVVVKDATAPDKPFVNEVTDKDSSISGQAEISSTVEVSSKGSVIGTGVAGADGNFAVTIPVQQAGTELRITAADKAGNISEANTVTVKDATAPEKPIVNVVTDKDSSITGQAEADATVEVKANGSIIGSGAAGADGKFALTIPLQKAETVLIFTAKDKAGNVSEGTTVTVKDGTPPGKPVVNAVTDHDTTVTGQAESGAKVDVKANGSVIGSATVGADGTYKVTIPVQKAAVQLTVTVTDPAGNVSEAAIISVDKAKLSGWVNENGKWYYYDPTTFAKKTGWYKVGSTWYFSDNTGARQTGWVKSSKTWYFLNSNGSMVTGWQKVGTTWYFFNSGGAMVTGWMKSGATWYFFTTSGAMVSGWMKSGTHWYYFNSGGAMQTGRVKIAGKYYTFDKNGILK
ncbi:Ig-like domain-containing protein [Neobacillus ginsengisoli]|uniref:Bacterial Ig domain-containing protein n=1 Tax=Neobacillus ginsengisoli TaxID=904295 RepID=A0ABT9Y0S8_9BACI|nr:Ig-like domain-containing protein [Neobacillus ginsengisoli]MDQ0200757.1 hypothetical protein [Neobacillus ginsengisoli]